MKKILFLLTVIFAFSFNANAQSKNELTKEQIVKEEMLKKEGPEVNAKNDSSELSKYLELDENTTFGIYRLFEKKYKTLQNELSTERKAELSRVIEAKLRATLTKEQMVKLEKNEELFKRIMN